ncbi:MAG: rod shape-determining protein MreC [Pseudomonadota bacterium]
MSRAPQAPLFVREMGLPARFGVYVLLGLLIAAVDSRYAALNEARAGLNTLLQPIRVGLAMPWEWAREVSGFFVTHGELQAENARLRREREHLLALQQDRLALLGENQQLRGLAALPPRPGVTTQLAEIVEVAADPFSRKVIINRGSAQGIVAGRPVIDGAGLVGQVTRVFPATAEVTLLTDREQGAPVQNLRNGLRVIVSGTGADNLLEVRFLDMHADIRRGDLLYTSGIDGVYPAGIPVARVEQTEPPRHTPFAKALCRPIGGVGRYRHVAVLKLAPTAPATKPASPPAAPQGHKP